MSPRVDRSSVSADPSKNVNAVEDFLEVVLSAYVIGAAKNIMGITDGEEISATTPLQTLSYELVKKFTSLQW